MFCAGFILYLENSSTFNALTSIFAVDAPLGVRCVAAIGEPNAQAEDQIGRQKALQGDCHRQGDACPARQASRHDQADEEADSSAPRHSRAVQDRRRQRQEILLAERLIVHLSRAALARPSVTEFYSRISVMSRVKRGVTSHAKHKKVFKAAKGYYGRRKNTIRTAKQAVEKAGQYAFRDRKRKKRTFRALWIQRLNAAVRPFGLTYSRFIDGLSKSGVAVDRKVLSDLAIHEPATFQAIAEKAKAALAA